MKVRIRRKENRYVIQKKQFLRWWTATQKTTRKNPKWWQSTTYSKPCIFHTREAAEQFLERHRVMINNYGEREPIEREDL